MSEVFVQRLAEPGWFVVGVRWAGRSWSCRTAASNHVDALRVREKCIQEAERRFRQGPRDFAPGDRVTDMDTGETGLLVTRVGELLVHFADRSLPPWRLRRDSQ